MPRSFLRLIFLAGFLLTFLSSTLLIVRRAPAQESTWIAYSGIVDTFGNDHLFRTTYDGRIRRRVLAHEWDMAHPVWANRAQWLVFAAGSKDFPSILFRIEADGQAVQRLLPHDEYDVAFHTAVPVVSPDDAWIYFLAWPTTIGHVYRVQPTGSEVEAVTAPILVDEEVEGFSLSPDGQWLALIVRHRTDQFGETALVVMNMASGEITRLLDDDRSYLQPVWSPDSQWLVVASAGQEADGALTIISRDGQTRRSLVQTPNQLAEYAAWSPDGRWIVFARVNFRLDGRFQFYRVRPDGTDLQALTDNFEYPTTPQWSPDSQWLAFNAGKPGYYGLYTMRADGSDLRYIAPMPNVTMPAWSPPVDKNWWGGGMVLLSIGVVIVGIIGSREKLKKEL